MSFAIVDASGIQEQLERLRRSYVEATLRQRLSIARQRLENPHHDANRLIAHVSAVEGFARSLCMHRYARTKPDLSLMYSCYRRKGAEELIAEYLEAGNLGSPSKVFGRSTWKMFGFAVQYRNLLAHECTYLGHDFSPRLIDACDKVLDRLAVESGVEPK